MEYALTVNNVVKTYRLYENNYQRLKESLSLISHKKYGQPFHALKSVSFNIAKGDIVGIIGTNGSGKSTLLKIITGVLQPSSGSVSVNGKISALLELGAGFNMEYTGLENIRLNGLMNGMSESEIASRIPEILSFAEIGDFVYQPVKTYSSGMFARLAFAVSINISPDILIIDEALSVGDMYFQEKCYEKMKAMVKSGATILFVSHSLPAVRNFCNKAIWLEKGEIRSEGAADAVCSQYKHYLDSLQNIESNSSENLCIPTVSSLKEKSKNKVYIRTVASNKNCYYMDEDIKIHITLGYHVSQITFGVGIIIRNIKGEIVTLFNTIRDNQFISSMPLEVDLIIPSNDLTEGEYTVSANLCDDMIMYPFDKCDDAFSFTIIPLKNKNGVPIAEGYYRQKHNWEY